MRYIAKSSLCRFLPVEWEKCKICCHSARVDYVRTLKLKSYDSVILLAVRTSSCLIWKSLTSDSFFCIVNRATARAYSSVLHLYMAFESRSPEQQFLPDSMAPFRPPLRSPSIVLARNSVSSKALSEPRNGYELWGLVFNGNESACWILGRKEWKKWRVLVNEWRKSELPILLKWGFECCWNAVAYLPFAI